MSSTKGNGSTNRDTQSFVHWAARYLSTPWETRAAVTGETKHEEAVIYTQWTGRYREIVAQTAHLQGGSRKVEEPISPEAFDPWGTTTEELSAQTTQVVCCRGCDGVKKIVCPTCSGSGRMRCEVCGGSGRVLSQRGNKFVNCKGCRGTGMRSCRCRSGHITCPTCAGVGRVKRWLEVEERQFQHPRKLIRADHGLSTATPPGRSDSDFNPPSPSVLWVGKTVAEAPEELRSWLAHDRLSFEPDAFHERVDAIGLKIFDRDVLQTSYALAGVKGHVARVGPRLAVIPQEGSARPFLVRGVVLALVAILVFAVGMALRAGYQNRHQFYLASSNADLLVLVTLLLALVATALTATMINRGLRRMKPLVATLGSVAGVAIAVGITALLTGNPSFKEAQALYLAGRAQDAEAHAVAAVDLGYDVEPCKSFVDGLRVDRVMNSATFADAVIASRVPLYSPEAKQKIEGRQLDLAISEIRNAQSLGNYGTTEGVVAMLPENLRSRPEVRAYLQAAYETKLKECIVGMDADCTRTSFGKLVLAKAAPGTIGSYRQLISQEYREKHQNKLATCEALSTPEQKLPCFKEAQSYLVYAETFGAQAEQDSTASATVNARIVALEAEIAAIELRRQQEQEKQAAAERAKAERDRIRRERQERARQSESSGRVQCCDGSFSPSCNCNRSLRGCCSHHGGVCGCD